MVRVPLAEEVRPSTLDEVVGQTHLLAKGEILRQIVTNKEPVNLILWGPPGTGKTTLARIIAKEVSADFIELSAVTAGKKDVLTVVEHAKQNWNLQIRTILFVDEIHRFNKAQQDAFLPHVESGLLTLIGATTENPSFEIITPLLSRSRVLVLQPLTKQEIIGVLQRAITVHSIKQKVNDDALDYLAKLSGGDARVALGNLELSLTFGKKTITVDTVKMAAQKKLPGYDKHGDMHYDVISAFIKSMRGSDERATLYYLARMLEAGEDPKFIARRMVIFASEDIGLAGNGALALAVATFQSVERIGLPEAKYNLYHCATALARSSKSRETTDLMHEAESLAKQYPHSLVPLHVRNAPTKLMKDMGYGKNYQWTSGFKPKKGFLPDDIR
jgi:putative ATPase